MKKVRIFLALLMAGLLSATAAVAQTRIKVACVGNSITYGFLLPDRETQAYPVRLQQLLGERYEVGNFGKSGSTLLNRGHRPYMRQTEFKDMLRFAADIAVIHLGINDTDPRNWPNYRDDFVRDYLALIDSLRAVNPEVRIIIARMTPLGSRHPRFLSGTRDWHAEIQTAIETVARHADVQTVDFYELLHAYPHLLPDAIHPDPEGAALMARKVYSAITGDYGGLRLSGLYTDNMVLQRNVPLDVSGVADAGERVTVSIGGQRCSAVTGKDGKWAVRLLPLKAGGPYQLTVSTPGKTLRYSNVLAGEVWLCSGQSNMEFMLKQAATAERDIPKADDNELRFYDMKARWRTNAVEWDSSVLDSLNALHYYEETEWEACTPRTAGDFSAVAYYFGRMLRDSLQVPVGLICNAVGGSPAEAWIDRSTLEREFPSILKDWKRNDFIQDWVRGRASLNIKRSANPNQRHPYEPCYLFEAGIAPLQSYPLKGVIWYQGESNAHNKDAHERLFKLLVSSWRKTWENARLPFYCVQLSSLNRPSWPWFRDSQRRLMQEIPYTGMAVSSDVGDSLDVHPVRKQPVGERLARWALSQTYRRSLTPSGPLLRKATFIAGAVHLAFDYGDGLRSADGQPLRTFEVAETDGLFHPAEAVVEGGGLKVWSAAVKHPHYVRYGWQPFTRANLTNDAGLPASTFRAEDSHWLGQTYRDPYEEAFRFFLNSSQAFSRPALPPCNAVELHPMKGFPKQEKGFGLGVSACFAGVVNGRLLMAGGCNFPDVPVADGGQKRYYRGIYAASLQAGSVLLWRKVGELPMPLAYGASVSTADGLICIGGMNAEGSTASVCRISPGDNDKPVRIDPLPPLPYALDNLTGSLMGNTVYVAGGNRQGAPSNTFLCLNLERPDEGWKELPPFPGNPRIQPVSAGVYIDGAYRFFLWGGFAPASQGREATLSVNGYCYDPAFETWMPLPVPTARDGEAVSLGGGAAVALDDGRILCMGGVDKDIFLSALRSSPAEDYLRHPAEWYRFNRRILLYDVAANSWQEVADAADAARAGAALVGGNGACFYIGGELKPGIRIPGVTKINLK